MNKSKVLAIMTTLAISTSIAFHVEAADLQKPPYLNPGINPYLDKDSHNAAMDMLYTNDLILQQQIDAIEGVNPDEINAALDGKADKADLDGKADKADLDSKADKSEVEAALDGKADKADLDSKADKSEVEAALDNKADKADLDSKADKADLDGKADKSEVEAALNNKADKSEVEAALDNKADKADLDSKADKADLDSKADKTDLDSKADKSEVEAAKETAETAKTNADNAMNVANEAKENVAKKADKTYVDEENNKQNKEISNNKQAISQERTDRELADARLSDRIDGLSNKIDELDGRVDKVGAIAVAMAGLHPLGYDSEHKTEFSMAAGSYSGETAYAAGIFHHPNEDVLLSIGFSICGSEKAGNIGATFRFGSSGEDDDTETESSEKTSEK